MNINKDAVWKLFSMVVGILIMPLAGWVWNTNVKVAELENNLKHIEQSIEELESKLVEADENAKSLIGVEKDIEYMKNSLLRIETLVTK
jgi:predicted RNase H-like nuclease (RuvC/YqgF family)|tara:strand:+ start:215 stop:481 length:267 start_codon:yes stop_codon:yes gene_type:complete